MKVVYKDGDIEELCQNPKKARKELGEKVAQRLHFTLQYIISADSLKDVKEYTPFNLHPLKGDKAGIYSIYLGAKTGFRLTLIPLDDDGNELQIKDNYEIYKVAKVALLLEVTNHYE